jgi:DNA-binding transcriptional ArsR family regulator
MGQALSNNSEHVALAKLCATLSNPTRIAILEKLACGDQCVKGEFLNIEGLSRFTVGQNLKELKKHGLIKGTLSSRSITYCLDYEKLEAFKSLFDDLYSTLIKNKERVNPTNSSCMETAQNQ